MKQKLLLVVIGVVCLCVQCADTPSSSTTADVEQVLVWSDDFNGNELDQSKWTAIVSDGCPGNCGFGNNELQYYLDDHKNLSVSDGSLKITALKDGFDSKDYTSAKLISKAKGDWQYGRIEVRAKLPQGKGTWPAIWMLPTLDRQMKWPRDGEIDIMEHVGYNQGMIYGTIHTEKYNHVIGTQKSDSIYLDDASDIFHEYELAWDQNKMVWSVDGKEYLALEKNNEDYEGWPFDQPFHLILNLAVGGNWGGKYGVDDSIWPQTMEIDYVKVYQNNEI
ncbi:glycoside hydrolase family 16 protein [Marinoscillum sp.]|uniref:glycoside hydrolase family 16 protein n=1 Tax=Marinoscillum sp. TaxID=2024838 RepID=UPI003BA954BD